MVSIIIPVYNVEQYLIQCLDSVVGQTYHDLEIILVDDGSKDKSGEICDLYAQKDSRIRVIHKKNAGVSAARNDGMRAATGEWILFVDSDDWIDKRLLEKCFEYITDETDICFFGLKETWDLAGGDLDDNREIQVKQIDKKDFLAFQYRIFNRDREAICDRNLIKLSSPCKIFKKELLKKHKLFFSEELVNGEDGVFNLYAYQYAQKGVCVESELYYYRMREDSVTHKYTDNIEKDFEKLHKEYARFVKATGTPEVYEEVLKERLIWSFSFCCILKYCHPNNEKNYKQRKEQFLNEYRNYRKAIKAVRLNHFGLKKKIIFYFIKKKMFLPVSVLCTMQYKKDKQK